MARCGERKLKEPNPPYLKNTDKSVSDLMRENNGLSAAVDVLTMKLVSHEASLRETLSRNAATITALEQRAVHSEKRLRMIEESLSWRLVKLINSWLDKWPRLKVFVKRVMKAVRWTATGQIVSKIKQYREVRRYKSEGINVSKNKENGFESFWVYPSTLPRELLTKIVSFMEANGPTKLIVAINFYAGGGAESAALDYAVSYARKNKSSSVIFTMTDNGPRKPLPDLPSNIFVVDLTTFDSSSDSKVRENYLYLMMQSTPLETFHIINSVVAYNLLSRIPSEFLEELNVVASIYALQFDPLDNTRIIGYGKDFLPINIEKIDCVVTDNRRFAIEGPLKLNLSSSEQKFKTVYNKSKLDDKISVEDSLCLMNERVSFDSSNSRLRVIWAGRLDREKRIDLLIEIARLTQKFCDFLVYGGAVVDGGYEDQLESLSNVSVLGPYRSPTEWDTHIKANAFLFTSVWEGMPNTVIEAAYMGYPVVASNVGGVGELITPQTGWLLDRYAGADFYAEALSEIFTDSTEAKRRTELLIKLAHSRHSECAYMKSLSTVPGYNKVK